jgi:hypothetical protein
MKVKPMHGDPHDKDDESSGVLLLLPEMSVFLQRQQQHTKTWR